MNFPVGIKSKVVKGNGFGHIIGIPTANFVYDKKNAVEYGVYGSYVYVDDKQYIGVTNVGLRPSVDNVDIPTVETYIIDFDGDIYGKEIELSLEFYIRGIHKYDSVEDLKNQVKKDVEKVKENLGG